MADLGADVIKLEPPDRDPYRHRASGPGVPESPYNYRWIVDNPGVCQGEAVLGRSGSDGVGRLPPRSVRPTRSTGSE